MSTAPIPARLEYAEAVHQLALLVPPGAVLSYGDVAELLGSGGPRQAGKAMASSPAATPWWRIIRSDGSLPAPLADQGKSAWATENTPRRGQRVDMGQARWQPDDDQWEQIQSLKAALHGDYLSPADDQL